jgi:hypothetical protein
MAVFGIGLSNLIRGVVTRVAAAQVTGVTVGQVITITGATGWSSNAINGQHRVVSIISSTEFTIDYDSSALTGTYVANSGTMKDQIYRENIFSVDLIEIHYTTPKYLCSGPYDIAIDTATAPNAGVNTYVAQGEFIGFDGVAEDFDVKVGKLSVTIAGVNSDLPIYSDPIISSKRVVLYRCFLDLTSGAVIGSPWMLFDGQINNVSIVETARTCTVTIDCASLFADFDRTTGRKTNNDSNWHFQGFQYDTSFEKSGLLRNTDVKWGRTN